MEKKEINKDEKINQLLTKWKELSRISIIILSAIQYKKSQEGIAQKVENESTAITYGIGNINRKVLENLKKYSEIEQEFKELMEHYEENLTELAEFYDCSIVLGYTKILEEEIKQIQMYEKIYELIKDENQAKEKADNSDDEIREEICNIEDEISKSELKVRRLKPTVRKRIEEKATTLNKTMEKKEQQLQRDVKGPKIFKKATKFFLGKINPHKMIEKNVFSSLKNRINEYETEEKCNIKKVNAKYKEKNIIETINEITKDKSGGKQDDGEEKK